MKNLEYFRKQLQESRKSGNKTAKCAFEAIVSAIQAEESRKGKELAQDAIYSLINKEIRQAQDSIGFLEKNDSLGQVESLQKLIEIWTKELPEMIHESKYDDLIDQAIDDFDQEGISFGKIMGEIKVKYSGRIDMAKVAGVLKKRFV